MGRQVLKGLTMLMLVIGLALASAAAANGQARKNLIVQVPFDFIVADKDLRSGKYTVRAINAAGDALVISSADEKHQMLRLTNATRPAKAQQEMQGRLVFHRYGNTYFLSQAWMDGESSGREFPKTRQERAIERELSVIASNDRSKTVYELVEVLATVR